MRPNKIRIRFEGGVALIDRFVLPRTVRADVVFPRVIHAPQGHGVVVLDSFSLQSRRLGSGGTVRAAIFGIDSFDVINWRFDGL